MRKNTRIDVKATVKRLREAADSLDDDRFDGMNVLDTVNRTIDEIEDRVKYMRDKQDNIEARKKMEAANKKKPKPEKGEVQTMSTDDEFDQTDLDEAYGVSAKEEAGTDKSEAGKASTPKPAGKKKVSKKTAKKKASKKK